MSDIHLITIETALLVSAFAFATWTGNKAHRTAMQVYSGVADGVRLSRRTRRLLLIHIYGGNNIVALVITTLVGLALVQIGSLSPSGSS